MNIPLDGECIHTSGPYNTILEQNSKIVSFYQQKLSGKRRPFTLEESKRRLINSFLYPLQYEIGQMYYNQKKKNPKSGFRKRRSEIRSSVTLRVGQVILHYTNLVRMEVGISDPKTQTFKNFGINFIHEKTNNDPNNPISLWQVREAIRLFEKYGYIRIEERKILQPNGTYRSRPSVIMVNEKLFLDIGFTKEDLNLKQNLVQRDECRDQLEAKNRQRLAFERATKKTVKKCMKSMRDLMKANPSYLSKEEKDLLKKEMPGYDRGKEFLNDKKEENNIYKSVDHNKWLDECFAKLRVKRKTRPPS
jgi:hypothetical protein